MKAGHKLEQIALQILDFAIKWESDYRWKGWDGTPFAESVHVAGDIWEYLLGTKVPLDLDQQYTCPEKEDIEATELW